MQTTRRKPRSKARAEQDQLAELKDSYILCRDLRHAFATDLPWLKVSVEGGVRGALYMERTLGCMRCSTTRTELARVHRSWVEIVRVSYHYPEDYSLRGVQAKGLQARIRREEIRRVMEGG